MDAIFFIFIRQHTFNAGWYHQHQQTIFFTSETALMNIIMKNLLIYCTTEWQDFHHFKLNPFPSIKITGTPAESGGVAVFEYYFTQWEMEQLYRHTNAHSSHNKNRWWFVRKPPRCLKAECAGDFLHRFSRQAVRDEEETVHANQQSEQEQSRGPSSKEWCTDGEAKDAGLPKLYK